MIAEDFLQQMCCTAVANYIRTNEIYIPDGFKLPLELCELICKQWRLRKRLNIDDWLVLNKLGYTEIDISGETLSAEDQIKLQKFENPQSVIYRHSPHRGGPPDSGLLFIRLIEDRTKLISLDLSLVEVNDGNREMIQKLLHSFPNLKKLLLETVNLENIRLWFDMLRNLIHLNISKSNIQSITGIYKLSKLERLHLGELDFTDNNWKELMELRNLRILDIGKTLNDRNYITDLIIEASVKANNEGHQAPWKNLWFLNLGKRIEKVENTPLAYQNILAAHPCLTMIFCIRWTIDERWLNEQIVVPPRDVDVVSGTRNYNRKEYLKLLRAVEHRKLFSIEDWFLVLRQLGEMRDSMVDENNPIIPTVEETCKILKAALDTLVSNPTNNGIQYYALAMICVLKTVDEWRIQEIDKQTKLDLCSQLLIVLDRVPLGTNRTMNLILAVSNILPKFEDFLLAELGVWKVVKAIWKKLSSQTLLFNFFGIYQEPEDSVITEETRLISVLDHFACLLPENFVVEPELLRSVTFFLILRIEKDIHTQDDIRDSYKMVSVIESFAKRTIDWTWFAAVGIPRLRALLGVNPQVDTKLLSILQSRQIAAMNHNL